ncbi:MAG: HPP family protein [Thiomicrorhabdus sp.]|nr:HPP family protein [Thiomicrorhabdus sp.]
MKSFLHTLANIVGHTTKETSHSEKIISAIGGFVAIFAVILISHQFLGLNDSWGIIASMGASAVLLFAVPNGPLSQPWPVFGGHIFAAIIGVSCALLIQEPLFAASSAVGITIGVMYYFNCIHPPGGATALTAVIGGESIHQLGYQFILTPVLLNVLCILLVAVLFNVFFHWRRYPFYLHSHRPQTQTSSAQAESISHQDFLAALKEIDSFVDINEDELRRIFELVHNNAAKNGLNTHDIQLGKVYSNGQIGKDWSMRQIIDESPDQHPNKDFVIFRQIAGKAKKRSDCLTRNEFAQWAKYEMIHQDGKWVRKP